jgi:hypothetical protein
MSEAALQRALQPFGTGIRSVRMPSLRHHDSKRTTRRMSPDLVFAWRPRRPGSLETRRRPSQVTTNPMMLAERMVVNGTPARGAIGQGSHVGHHDFESLEIVRHRVGRQLSHQVNSVEPASRVRLDEAQHPALFLAVAARWVRLPVGVQHLHQDAVDPIPRVWLQDSGMLQALLEAHHRAKHTQAPADAEARVHRVRWSDAGTVGAFEQGHDLLVDVDR